MSLYRKKLRKRLKILLKGLGFLGTARWFKCQIEMLINPQYSRLESNLRRLRRRDHQLFLQFKRQYGDLFKYSEFRLDCKQKRILIVGVSLPLIGTLLGLIKALEMDGFIPVVLIMNGKQNLEFYKLAGIKEVIFLRDFIDEYDLDAVEATLGRFQSIDELQGFTYAGARVGRFAVSTSLRSNRMASFDLKSPHDHRIILEGLVSSMAAATAAQRVLQKSRPDLALIWDGVYTPEGELFENCLAKGIDVIIWESAHRKATLMLKRYTYETRDEHPVSLSSTTWRLVREMVWTNSHRDHLLRELYGTYASGEWYSAAGTQFDKRFVDADEIQRRLGLDPAKKTAFIFPHILWDGSLAWGTDLFRNYEEWFIATVQTACANSQVNWVIKIHPSHVFKGLIDGYQGEPAEVIVLRKHIGELPAHVFMIPAESDISTFSLFELMNYCITVRGTIGIEAASLGIPVLTAGTGRYDRRGFTIDSDSCEEYINRLTNIQEIPRLSPTRRELAERFAYGLFILRPLPLKTVSFDYHKDYGAENGYAKTQINITRPEEWYETPDLKAFAKWVSDSKNPDFLMPLPE